ncbi:exopolysaccharide biosynthesis protein YbjH [Paraperlucidibaca baekdonensis]|uniref:Exopolysaccharide biosynthesis protein YbjH n=1 Tax=Paraperlucidibaca baekdonensis TaxID=748120 RepID=A0A3E0H5W8_9GAMM|nr:YjbH domain-containing protein [Paraperlucidibaca baekdonensis]REH38840.1 exopolysaccharide biosynthesis protein YbjH [Paraperlucidibaca baekdonensis]
MMTKPSALVLGWLGLALLPSVVWAETEPTDPFDGVEFTPGREIDPVPLFATRAPVLYSDLGGVGLLQTPTARHAPDGTMALAFNKVDPYRRYTFTAQVLPWLEFNYRYTRIEGVQTFTGTDNVDKGFDLSFRLLQETERLPALALGLKDIAGTGLFDSEFLVANKQWGDFDVSLGLAWGYLGNDDTFKNPFCSAKDSFCERPQATSGRGGNVEAGRFFKGPTALFGGVAWHTPLDDLSLAVELDGNDYSREPGVQVNQDLALNVGATYRVTPGVDFRVGYERGDTVMFGIVLNTNFTTLRQVKAEPKPTALQVAPAEQNDWPGVSQRLQREAGYAVSGIYQQDDTLTVEAVPTRYRDFNQGRERALRVLAATAPDDITQFQLTEFDQTLPQVSVAVSRDDVVAALTPSDDQPRFADLITAAAPRPADGQSVAYEAPKQSTSFAVSPYFQQGIGGVDAFYVYDLGVRAVASWQREQSLAQMALRIPVLNNYNDLLKLRTPTRLPEVRTRIAEYVDQPVRIEGLQFTQFARLNSDISAQAYGGILELMYAGVGAEALYRPVGSRWGVAVDVNRVRQRDPNDELGFLPYEVTTGHVTLYNQWPDFYNIQSSLAVGQYLAGDVGGTLTVAREFDSGVVFGGFAAKTNVSTEDFGEGSFNKGLFIQIPLDLLFARNTRSQFGLGFVPILRDGGQMLYRRNTLWGGSVLRTPAP